MVNKVDSLFRHSKSIFMKKLPDLKGKKDTEEKGNQMGIVASLHMNFSL